MMRVEIFRYVHEAGAVDALRTTRADGRHATQASSTGTCKETEKQKNKAEEDQREGLTNQIDCTQSNVATRTCQLRIFFVPVLSCQQMILRILSGLHVGWDGSANSF
jgi:hypothetical protein